MKVALVKVVQDQLSTYVDLPGARRGGRIYDAILGRKSEQQLSNDMHALRLHSAFQKPG